MTKVVDRVGDVVRAEQIKGGVIYGFEIARATLGLPPLTGAERDAEIARLKAEAAEADKVRRSDALATKRMTVSDLIEALKAYPADMPVMTPGFDECGYEDVRIVGTERIVLGGTPNPHCASHGAAESTGSGDVTALVLDH